jgi:hypothetical protein
MKNKKICVGMFLALVAFSQEVCAMNAARKVAQFGWRNRFALIGTGVAAATAFDYKNSCKLVKQEPMAVVQKHEASGRLLTAYCDSKKVAPEIAAMGPLKKVLTNLLAQKHSPATFARIEDSVRNFIANQRGVAQDFEGVIEEYMGGTIVKGFNIPEESTRAIKEKLSLYTSDPILFRSGDEDSIPQLQTVKAFEAVGFSMNKAAERAFWNTHKGGFNREQMGVIVEHECLHIENGDGDLKVLFTFLSQNRRYFSNEEFYKIMGAFGEDFLNHRKGLIAAITKEAKEMGIHDLSRIENFDMDKTAFERYFETRVDETILGSKDKKKMEAYREYYKNRNDSQALKDRTACDKDNVIFCLRQGRTIPLDVADFNHPTDQERVDACDKALAELKAAKK